MQRIHGDIYKNLRNAPLRPYSLNLATSSIKCSHVASRELNRGKIAATPKRPTTMGRLPAGKTTMPASCDEDSSPAKSTGRCRRNLVVSLRQALWKPRHCKIMKQNMMYACLEITVKPLPGALLVPVLPTLRLRRTRLRRIPEKSSQPLHTYAQAARRLEPARAQMSPKGPGPTPSVVLVDMVAFPAWNRPCFS